MTTDTTGKTITLHAGVVVTDIGPGIANGQIDPVLRRCVTDDGVEHVIIARVVRETPETLRRASLPQWIY